MGADYIGGIAVRVSDEDRTESQAGAPNFKEGTPQPQAVVNLDQESETKKKREEPKQNSIQL